MWPSGSAVDPPVRELMGYRWLRRDEWLHRRFGDIVRLVFALARGNRRPVRGTL